MISRKTLLAVAASAPFAAHTTQSLAREPSQTAAVAVQQVVSASWSPQSKLGIAATPRDWRFRTGPAFAAAREIAIDTSRDQPASSLEQQLGTPVSFSRRSVPEVRLRGWLEDDVLGKIPQWRVSDRIIRVNRGSSARIPVASDHPALAIGGR